MWIASLWHSNDSDKNFFSFLDISHQPSFYSRLSKLAEIGFGKNGKGDELSRERENIQASDKCPDILHQPADLDEFFGELETERNSKSRK